MTQFQDSTQSAEASETTTAFDETAIPEPEPWEPWETRLCLWSIGLGIAGLCILGAIVNVFIL